MSALDDCAIVNGATIPAQWNGLPVAELSQCRIKGQRVVGTS